MASLQEPASLNKLALLIEDNEANRQLATFLLKHMGLRVSHAHTGLQGLELLKQERPDIVLLDIQMPEMDGYEVAARIRAEEAYRDLPILVVSSYAMAGDRKRALELGVDDYLEKPYEPNDLISRVKSALERRVST